MMATNARWGMVTLAASIAAALLGCPSLGALGAGGRDAGSDVAHDVARHDVALSSGAAVLVASNDLASNWCAVTDHGDVECWGNNESGQLGNGTTTPSTKPVKVEGLPGPAASVSIGIGTVCAATRSGAAYCWGQGAEGELGNGQTTPFTSKPTLVSGLGEGVTAISSGQRVACAVQAGRVLCWGDALTDLLGTPSTANALVPTPIPELASGVTAVSVGINVACAVKAGGVYCWGGFDNFGELGNGTMTGSNTPVMVEQLGEADAVSAGAGFVCALESVGAVKCWGDGVAGALGNGQLAVSPIPVQVQGLESGVSAVSSGAVSVCAIKTDGSVVCWGYAADGELGNGTAESDSSAGPTSTIPVAVEALSARAISISTGQAPCVATTAGSVECWGIVAEDALTPVAVPGLGQVGAIATGGDLSTSQYACAVWGAQKTVSCWGGNGAGQFGYGMTASSTIPIESLALPAGMTSISAGTGVGTTCGVASGIAYCWGDNAFGQLGNGTKMSGPTAVAVTGLTGGVLSVGVGLTSACAITTSADAGGGGGAVYCWGDNTYGQLGNGTATASLVPVPVTGLASGVTAIALGTYSACALRTDGTAACWGANSYGQLGDGTQTTRLVPTKVMGLAGATAIALGWWTTCAVTSGTIQCWGDNSFGELGSDSTSVGSTFPMTVSGIASGATAVAVGQTSACGVVDGGAQCWGLGPTGNDSAPITTYLTPVPVTGLTSGVTAVSVSAWFACATVNGDVRCWGFNTTGELGNNGAVDAFLPAPVLGFP